jgi:hypothetical protein
LNLHCTIKYLTLEKINPKARFLRICAETYQLCAASFSIIGERPGKAGQTRHAARAGNVRCAESRQMRTNTFFKNPLTINTRL